MIKDDGGPVHPTTTENGVYGPMHGMSLRDYFAGQAMQGKLAANSIESGHYFTDPGLADIAYEMADAMIEARNEP